MKNLSPNGAPFAAFVLAFYGSILFLAHYAETKETGTTTFVASSPRCRPAHVHVASLVASGVSFIARSRNEELRKGYEMSIFATRLCPNCGRTIIPVMWSSSLSSSRQSVQWKLHMAPAAAAAAPEKETLLNLVREAPPNAPSSSQLTQSILESVRDLEDAVPFSPENADSLLERLAGSWDLLWTAQDQTSKEFREGNRLLTWINPLENQVYSINPSSSASGKSGTLGLGRSNPFLPRPVQDQLEKLGILRQSSGEGEPIRSVQVIDTNKLEVRNIVSFEIPPLSLPFLSAREDKEKREGFPCSLTVTVRFQPNKSDKRRIDVKFETCRLLIPKLKFDTGIELRMFGPSGWIRTTFIDEEMRIARGHKGSVFVLKRKSSK